MIDPALLPCIAGGLPPNALGNPPLHASLAVGALLVPGASAQAHEYWCAVSAHARLEGSVSRGRAYLGYPSSFEYLGLLVARDHVLALDPREWGYAVGFLHAARQVFRKTTADEYVETAALYGLL